MKFLIILLTIISCKTDKSNSVQSTSVAPKVTAKEIQNKIQQQDLEFYNEVENLGVGILKAKNNNFLTYDDSLLNNKNEEDTYNPKKVKPIFFKPDYNIFYLTCLKENETYYTMNNGNKIYLNADDFEFYTWESFFKNTTGIGNIDWTLNPALNEPNGTKLDLDIDSDYIAKEIQGDWLKIDNEEKGIGWIKWRKDNKLLIEVYLLM